MNQSKYDAIFNSLDIIVKEEKEYCKQYCELNPTDKFWRERDRDLILCALCRVRAKLVEALQ